VELNNETKARTANKVLPKAGLNGFNWAFVQGSTFVLRLSFCAKNPAFGNTQNVVAKSAPLLSPQRSRGLHPLLVPPLRGLRTTSGFVKFSNLEQVRIWNFTNPRER
jgi:hypothetical protein